MIVGEATVVVHMDTSAAGTEMKAGIEKNLAGAEAAGAQAGAGIAGGVEKGLKETEASAARSGGRISSGLTSAISGVGGMFGIQSEKMTSALEKVNLPAVGAVVAVGAIGAAAVGAGAAFQSATASLAAKAGITQKAATDIGHAFDTTAGEVTFSATQITGAYSGVAAQLGNINGKALSSKQALDVMRASMDLAEASGSSLDAATKSVATTLQTFHLGVDQAGFAADNLNNVARTTGQSIDTVAGAYQKIKASLGAATPDLATLSGLTADLAKNGEGGRKSIMALTQGLTALAEPTQKQIDAQKFLGVSTRDAHGNFVGMENVIDQLKPKLAGLTPLQQQQTLAQLVGSKAAAGFVGVVNDGSAALDKHIEAMAKSGSAHAAAAKATDTFRGSWEKTKSAITDALQQLGEKLVPVLSTAGKFLAEFVGRMAKDLPGIMHAIGAGIDAVKPALTILFDVLKKVFGFIVDHKPILIGVLAAVAVAFFPVTTAVLGVAALASLLISHWGEIRNFFEGLLRDVAHFFQAALAPITGVFDTIKNAAVAVVDWIRSHWQLLLAILVGPIGLAVLMIKNHWDAIVHFASEAIDKVVGFFTSLPGRIVGALGDIVSFIFSKWTAGAQYVYDNLLTPIVNFFTGLPQRLVSALADLITFIWGNYVKMGAWIDTNILGPIVTFFSGLPGRIVSGLGDIVGTIFGALKGAWAWIKSNVYDPIVTGFTALPGDIYNALAGAASAAAGLFGSIGKSIVNGIIGGLNHIVDTIDSALGGISFFGLHPFPAHLIPDIPKLAAGGLVTSPTIALIGEAGPEFVIPAKNLVNLSAFGGASGSAGGGGNTLYVTVAAGAVQINPPPGASASAMTQAVNDGFTTLGREILAGISPIRSPAS